MLYRVTAQVVTKRGGWISSRQVPTFLLDGEQLGIVDEAHAEQIAREVVMPVDLNSPGDSIKVHLCVVRV